MSSSSGSSMLDTLVDRVGRLYTLPAVALEIIRLSRDPKMEARKLADCLRHDPALTGRVLQFVNSPVFGLNRRIASVDDAVAVLGVQPLRGIVLGFSLPPQLQEGIEKSVLTRFWRHSLAKALAARELARMNGIEEADEAFVAGLLQHIGMLVLIQELGQPYVEFLGQVWNERGNVTHLEVASLGFDHRVVSSRLAERWQLPETLGLALAHPWNPDQIEQVDPRIRSTVRRLHLAEYVARLLHDRDPIDWEAMVDSAKRHFAFETVELEELLRRLDDQLREIGPMFSLEWDDRDSYATMLLESRDLLIRLSESWIDPRQARSGPIGSQAADKLKQAVGNVSKEVAAIEGAAQRGVPLPATPAKPLVAKPLVANAESGDRGTGATKSTILGSAVAAASRPAPTSGSVPSLSSVAPVRAEGLGLTTAVRRSVSKCRQQRYPLALMLIEADRFAEVLRRHGHAPVEHAQQDAMKVCREAMDPGDPLIPISDARWGIVLEDCDRGPASNVGRELLARLRAWSEERIGDGGFPLTYSIGVACVGMILKNFEGDELIRRAEGCLSAAQLSGGDTVKTISV